MYRSPLAGCVADKVDAVSCSYEPPVVEERCSTLVLEPLDIPTYSALGWPLRFGHFVLYLMRFWVLVKGHEKQST